MRYVSYRLRTGRRIPDEQESIISWAWHRYPAYRERYAAAAHDPACAHLTFIRVATRADVRQLLDSAR